MAYTPSYIWNIPPHGFLWRFPKMWVPPNLPFWIDMFHSKPSNLVYPHDYGNLQVHMLYLYMVYICSYIYIYICGLYLYIYGPYGKHGLYMDTKPLAKSSYGQTIPQNLKDPDRQLPKLLHRAQWYRRPWRCWMASTCWRKFHEI